MRPIARVLFTFLTVYASSAVAQTIAVAPKIAQGPSPAEALLAKARALYDAPFTRDLGSFDCALEFDWKQHFIDLVGSVPAAAQSLVATLQPIRHRVRVNRSGAVISDVPRAPDLAAVAHAAELEQGFHAVASAGLNAWIAASTNVILPVGPTSYQFEEMTGGGYRLQFEGKGVSGTLLLTSGMQITSGVSQRPQPLRFATEFTPGPDGLLLSSLKTDGTTDASEVYGASFAYTYQAVDGIQIPATVSVKTANPESWHYALTGCKVVRGIIIKVAPPPK